MTVAGTGRLPSFVPTVPNIVVPPAAASPPPSPLVQNPNLSLLRLCTHLKEANQIHALMIKSSQSSDPYFAGRLAEFYALSDSGCLDDARKVLDSLSDPPVFIYNTLMRAHLITHHPLHSLLLYREMLSRGGAAAPDHFSFTFSLKACTALRHLSFGAQLHSQIVKLGLQSNPHIRNKLMHLYAVCGDIVDARKVFDGSLELDMVAWNTMLEAYAEAEDEASLRRFFFREMPELDAVSWNTVMAFLVAAARFEEAIFMFRSMQEARDCPPNGVSAITILTAIAHLGVLAQGLWLHTYIDRHGIRVDEKVSSALINMYSKCGFVEGAVYTFLASEKKLVDTWNSMISGFATNSHSLRALDLFEKMEKASSVVPNSITFYGVLSACSHGGLVVEGTKFFEKMRDVYKIEPDIGHRGCMVDLFCRAGLFQKAEELIKEPPMVADAIMWKTVVGACRVHKNFALGEQAGLRLIQLAPEDSAGYILLSNIYAKVNDWNAVHKVRKTMMDRGIRKLPGCSSIELNGWVHEFIAGDNSHHRKEDVYKMLDEMGERLRLAGYKPDVDQVLLDIEEEKAKESSLALHGEKLAMAFGLIGSRPGTAIRIVKNLRVCGDCHEAAKLISSIYGREIIIRDSRRFHHFKEGVCSCREYW